MKLYERLYAEALHLGLPPEFARVQARDQHDRLIARAIVAGAKLREIAVVVGFSVESARRAGTHGFRRRRGTPILERWSQNNLT